MINGDMTKKKTLSLYFLAFFVPVLVMASVFAMKGVWPFGDSTVMIGDTTYQFVDYLSYLKTVFRGDNDLTYSLSKTLGGEMSGFAAYYYLNPLYLLVLPFSREYLPVGISLIFIIAPGLMSLSLCIVLEKLYGCRFASLIFSYAYGLMSFVVVYNELFQHFGNFILLPVVYFGLKRLIENKKPGLDYILSLAFVIIGNYYTGYMICLFCLIYFAYETALNGFCWKKTAAFASGSLIAGGLSAAVLIPAILSLSGEKDTISIGLFLRMNPLDLFSKLYTGSFRGDLGTGLPNIFCGTLITVLLIWYFCQKGIRLKERILTGLVLIFFMACFCINTLYVIWHGLNEPIGFPHRFAFLCSFFMIIKSAESWEEIKKASPQKATIVTAALFLSESVIIIVFGSENTSAVNIAIDAFLLTVILTLLWIRPKNLLACLIFLQVFDLSLNAAISLTYFDFTKMSEYRSEINRIASDLQQITENDPSLYRIEKYFRRSHNDAMMFAYNGLSHYSSTEKKDTISYMGDLGFRDNENWTFYNRGNTSFADCFLGVKYIISQFGGTGKPYEKATANGDDTIFKNPYVLPLLFSCTEKALGLEKEEGARDPFAYQQKIADALPGGTQIFHKLLIEPVTETETELAYDFTIPEDGILEAYFTAPGPNHAHILLDSHDYGEYFTTYEWGIMDLEHRKAGETHRLTIKAGEGEKLEDIGICLYQEDFEALRSLTEEIKKKPCELKKITSSKYAGTIQNDTGYVLFTVPYDGGWRAYAGKERLEIRKAAGDLTAVCLPEGCKEILLEYKAPGRTLGISISCLCLLLLSIYVVYRKKIRKNSEKYQISC